ncbi:MAG: ATP-binding cassette domain-containing protein [Rhodocyclaceae bacterium]|nr:ATP-binding cassette domain-containing protein [Rhodocyclaceae bacterium]
MDVSLRVARPDFRLEVDLRLPLAGITVLFGTSGSGKTTLLRAIAGLEPDTRGRVSIGGRPWQDDAAGVRVPVWQRRVGYVFQEASLFEHLDVRGNVEYGLRWLRGRKAGTRPDPGKASFAGRDAGPQAIESGADLSDCDSPEALEALIDTLGIGALRGRRVDTLSGGQRQRVAIARALAVRPALLLLDEPLAALDFARRDEIMGWLEALRDRTGTPMLYVTHSLEELERLAGRVVVLRDGQVSAVGAPEGALRAAGLDAAADRLQRLRLP